jgi:multidrug resistance efflux pump
MKNPPNSPPINETPLWRRLPRWAYGVVVVAAVFAGWRFFRGGGEEQQRVTFEAKRGPLTISVIQGGSIEALASQEIRSEVRGYQGTKILKIVEEGYLVTDEDVRTNKVLVELDSSELKQRLLTQESEQESRFSMMTESRQAYEIQLGQNQADIKAADQKVKFARMDLDKFLGVAAAQELIEEVGLKLPEPPDLEDVPEMNLEAATAPTVQPGQLPANLPPGTAAQLAQANAAARQPKLVAATSLEGLPGITVKTPPPVAPPPEFRPGHELERQREAESLKPTSFNVDFSKYADTNKLGDGTALQDLRKKQDDLVVAEGEMSLAQVKLNGTKRLLDNNFVTRTEMENEELNVRKMELRVDTAKTALRLHETYEFPKLAEETVSKYEEAIRVLDKAYKEAISKLAQARARKISAENRFELGLREIRETREQIARCTLTATTSGLVVYGASGNQMIYYGGQEQIREGATVRERQTIITIPDMNKMSVQLKVHESHIKKVRKDLRARITLDAFPDEQLTGFVSKVGVLPDSQNRWMSPDMKVYLTTVNIDGTYEWVKPGMSAKVEILVNQLEDAVYIPLQAVNTVKSKAFCHVVKGGSTVERAIVTGEFNDEFIEVKEGLQAGELVMVRPPKPATEEETEAETPPAPAAPVTATPAAAG